MPIQWHIAGNYLPLPVSRVLGEEPRNTRCHSFSAWVSGVGHEQELKWWDAVDVIGIDAYYRESHAKNKVVAKIIIFELEVPVPSKAKRLFILL